MDKTTCNRSRNCSEYFSRKEVAQASITDRHVYNVVEVAIRFEVVSSAGDGQGNSWMRQLSHIYNVGVL